jgi:hypothetical protein
MSLFPDGIDGVLGSQLLWKGLILIPRAIMNSHIAQISVYFNKGCPLASCEVAM